MLIETEYQLTRILRPRAFKLLQPSGFHNVRSACAVRYSSSVSARLSVCLSACLCAY